MAASVAGSASGERRDSRDLRALAGGTGAASRSRTAGRGGAGPAGLSVRAGASGHSAACTGVDADFASAGSRFVLGRSGHARGNGDLAESWWDVAEASRSLKPLILKPQASSLVPGSPRLEVG